MDDSFRAEDDGITNSGLAILIEAKARQATKLAKRLAEVESNAEKLYELLSPCDGEGWIQLRAVKNYLGIKGFHHYFSDDFVERSTGNNGYEDIKCCESIAFQRQIDSDHGVETNSPHYETDTTNPRYIQYRTDYAKLCAKSLASEAIYDLAQQGPICIPPKMSKAQRQAFMKNHYESTLSDLCRLYIELKGMERSACKLRYDKPCER